MPYITQRGEPMPAAVTMATGADRKARYLVRSRADWTFLDTSSDCSPETQSRTEDAHTFSLPTPPCSHTCHSYTGRDLPRGMEEEERWDREGENHRHSGDIHHILFINSSYGNNENVIPSPLKSLSCTYMECSLSSLSRLQSCISVLLPDGEECSHLFKEL